MRYYVTINGKRYEVDVVRADAFQGAAPVVAAPVAAPAPVAAQPAAKKMNLAPKGFEVLTADDYFDEEDEE